MNTILLPGLALDIRNAILAYKERGGENKNAFSAHATYEDGVFSASAVFYEDDSKTILYSEDTDNNIVQALFDLDTPEADAELLRLADLMIEMGWVPGTPEHEIPKAMREKQVWVE